MIKTWDAAPAPESVQQLGRIAVSGSKWSDPSMLSSSPVDCCRLDVDGGAGHKAGCGTSRAAALVEAPIEDASEMLVSGLKAEG